MSTTLLPTAFVAGALLAASARFTIPSAFYFVCFLYIVARPIVVAPVHTGESRLRILFWISLTVISTLMTIAHITFQSILASGTSGDAIGGNSSAAQLLAIFDLTDLSSSSCGLVHILPDAALCVVGFVGCVLSCRRARSLSASSSSSSSSSMAAKAGMPATYCCCRMCTPHSRVTMSVVIFIGSAMAAVALAPTILMLPVTVGLVLSLVAGGLSKKVTIVRLLFSYCKPAMLYLGLVLTVLYSFQISGCNVPCGITNCIPNGSMSSSQPTLLDAVGLVGFPKTLPGDGRPITSFCLLIFMYATLSVVLNIGLLPSSPSSIMHDAEGGLRTSLLAHESKSAASTIARAQDSQSVMSDESSAMSALRPRNDAASIVRHQFPVFNNSSMPVQIFLVTTALWSLWFPSILSLPVMLHAMLSFTTVGLQVRESLISTKTLRVILLYMACLFLVYSGFSTPYVYEYVTLGCSSQHQENATAKPCSRDAIFGLKPERWATLWGVGWAIPSSLDRLAGAQSLWLALHLITLGICSQALRSSAQRLPPTIGSATAEDDLSSQNDAGTSDSTIARINAVLTWICMWCIKWCGLLWALVQEYAFLVSLLVLYVGGLSKIDLIHSIYMLFFVVFVVFPNVRRTRWRLLVGYSGMVVAAIFVYKVISEAGTEADLPVSQQPPIIIEIGLDASLPGRLSAPGELITGHYIFPISMIIFWAASLQMSLYTEQSASARRERLDGFAGMLPEKLLKWIAQGGTAYQHYGVYALCVIFLCLGLQNRIKMTNLTDLIAVIVLLGMGLMFSGKPFETTQKRVFRILAFLSFLKGLELFTRYLFQYEIVCKFITPIFQCQCTCTEGGNEKAGLNCTPTAHNSSGSDMCSFIFQEIGLTQDPYLYRALFDSTAVFVVIVLQLKYSHGFSQSRSVPCGREGKDEEKEDVRTELDIDIATPDHVGCCEILAKRSVNMIQFLLYYNMGKLTLFCSALMALFEDESAISLALLIMVLFYLQVCMGKMKQPAWHGAWRPFFIVSSVSMVCQYIFEFSIFRTGEWLSPIATNISAWIGLDHHSEKIPAELSSYGEMWSVFGLQAMVMTVCAVHRWSHTLRESVMSIEKLWSTEEKPNKLASMWQHSEQQQQQRRRPRSPLSCGLQFRLGARWYLSTHMNYDLAILSLLLSAFVHIDIRSIGYMFFVLYATMKGRSKAMAGFHLMQWFVMSSIIYQCVLSTQFPVGTSLQQWWEDVLSGFHQAPGVGHWFTFMNQDNKTAVFDFCAVFFAKLHTNPRFEKLENTPERGETKTNMRSNSERYPNMDNTDVDYTDNNDFTVDTSGFCDWMLCLIHELSVPLLFALCVLVGMAYPEYGLLGLGYVIFGAAHLSRFSPEPSKRYKLRHLRGIRFYNWLVMFATVVYQAPWIPVAPSFQDAGGSVDYAFKYKNTCESRLVTRECMRDFASTFAQLSGLPKMSPPFDPDYPGNCGCNATIFDMARNGNISTICGAHGKDCCAEPTCASSFKKRRNVLSIAMFMFISFVCHVISSPSHKFYVDARRRRHATALRKSNNINMVVLRKLTNTWKQLTRRKFLMEMRLRRVISLVTDLQYEVSGARESSSMIRRWIVPPRMSPLIVVDATSSSVTLRWEPLEDDVSSSILDYIIQRDESGSALLSVYEHDIVVDKEEAIEMQWTVNGLSPRTDYDFVISARNETGTGRPSLPTRASTLPDEDEVGDGNRTCLDAEQGISSSQVPQQSEDSYFGTGEGKMKEERLPGTDLEEFGAREHESKSQKDEDGASKTTTQCHQSFWPWLEKALVLLAKTMETNDGKLDAAGNSPQLDSNSNDWTRLLWHALLSQTGGAIPIMLVLFAILHSSLYALALPVSYFIYAVWQSPRVRVGYWDFLVGYILCTIVLRFLVQLPLFCFNSTSEGSSLRLSVQPFCPSSGSEQISTIKALADESVNPLHLFFFYKKEDADFFGYLWVDILAVLTIILHKHQLYMRGLWQMDTHVSTRNSRLMNLVKNGGLQTLPASASYWQQGIAFARRVLPMLDKGSASQFDARRAMSLLDGTEDPDIVETQTPKCDDPSPVVLRKAPSSSQFCSKDLCEADRRFMDYILDTLGPSVTLKPGTEHYTLGTAAQMSSCLFLFLFTTAMTSKSGDVSESIAVITGSSTFSKTMVLLLMYHIAVMMFDRAALLCQDLRLKIAVLCVTVLFTHYFVFIYVQESSQRWIENNPTLLIYYFLQLTFALASGWQIREGYCVFPTTSQTQDEDYNACASIIYKTWRGIPLMREMRSIFNWIFSETSLDVFMWLQMDDLYATLAIVKFNMSYRVRDKETLSGKNRQPFLWKFVFGWLIFILILLILLGPIFLFSPLNPATKPNPLVQASVSVSLSAGTKMSNELKYTLFQSSNHTNVTSPITSSSVSTCVGEHSDKIKLRKVNETGQMQLVMLPTYSDELWSVTPSAIAHFRMLLLDRDGLIMKITLNYQFVRNKPEGQTVTAGEFHIDITNPSRCALAARLGASNASLTSAKCNLTRQAIVSGYTVNFTNAEFYPPILHVSSTKDAAGPENISSDTLGLSLRLDGSSADDVSRWVNNPGKNLDPTLWWTAHAISNWDCEGEGVPTDEGIVFVVFSDDAPAGAAQLILTSLGGGLIAVYIFLVGTVASYVRGFLFNPIYNVPFTEIPYPELLLEVCEGIKIMRVSGYEGHRRDEVLTYKFLVDVIRSSYLLSRLTNTREPKKKVKEE